MTMNNSTKHKAIHETAEHAITDYQELNDLELEEVAGGRCKIKIKTNDKGEETITIRGNCDVEITEEFV